VEKIKRKKRHILRYGVRSTPYDHPADIKDHDSGTLVLKALFGR